MNTLEHGCRLHSAGHLLDAAMRNVGKGSLIPSKGHHFNDGNAHVGMQLRISISSVDSPRLLLWTTPPRMLFPLSPVDRVRLHILVFPEYIGDIPAEERDSLIVTLEAEVKRLIAEDGEVQSTITDGDGTRKYSSFFWK